MNPVRIDRQMLLSALRAHGYAWLCRWGNTGPVAACFKKQADLPPDATADEYDAISVAHGRGYQTYVKCDGCARYVAAVVRIGRLPVDDNGTAFACRDCLIEALALLPEPVEVQP